MPHAYMEQHAVPASRGRSRGSCCALVSPAMDELWLEQPPQHIAIYTTPGNPYPAPWPPKSPLTRREIRRVLELPSDHVPKDAWADAPGSAKAAAREALHPGKRKAPLHRASKTAGGSSSAPSGRPAFQGSSTAPAAFDPPAFLRRPAPDDPTTSPFFFKISAGSTQPSRPHDSPLSGTRPTSTFSNVYSDRSLLGSPALSTRPGSQVATRDFWARPESRPPAAVLRSAGCLKAGVAAAVGLTGATAAESAIAAAALAWDLAPPLLQEASGEGRPPGHGSGRFLRSPSPASPWRRREEAVASLHACLGRVARRVEPHKAETEQWSRGGKAVPAAVERRRRHMALPLLSPQTLSDWELLLEPSRRQIMGQMQEVTNALKMAPRSTHPAPASMPALRPAGLDSPDQEHSFSLDTAELSLQQAWEHSGGSQAAAQEEEEVGGLRSQGSAASLQPPGVPVPPPSLAFQEEFRRLHQQLQQQHGTLPPLVSDLAKQQQQQQWRRQQEQQQLSAAVEADAEMQQLWAEPSGASSTGSGRLHQPRPAPGAYPRARAADPGSRSGSSLADSEVQGSRGELSLAQLVPGEGDEAEQRHAAESEASEAWVDRGRPGREGSQTPQLPANGSLQGSSSSSSPVLSLQGGVAAQGGELGPSGRSSPDPSQSGVWQADGAADVAGRPSFLNHFSTDPMPHHWAGSPPPPDNQGGAASGSGRQEPLGRSRSQGSDAAAARAAQPEVPGLPEEDGFRFSPGQGPARVHSAEAASRSPAAAAARQLGDREKNENNADRTSAGARSRLATAAGVLGDDDTNDSPQGADDPIGLADVGPTASPSAGSDDADAPATFSTNGAPGADEDAVEQSPVKTSGIGYTVVKSVQVWQPDLDEQQEAARLQQLEQLQQELGDDDHSRAAKLRAGSRAAKALQKQLGEGEAPGFGGTAAPEGVSMLRLAPASRQLRPAGPGTDRPGSPWTTRPGSASSSMDPVSQQSSLPRTPLNSSISFHPAHVSSNSASRHVTPRPAAAPPSSHHIVSMTTRAGQAVDTQSIWTGPGHDS